MTVTDTDRLICATLAAAKAAVERKEKHGQYLQEYEIMLKTMERRRAAALKKGQDDDSSESGSA